MLRCWYARPWWDMSMVRVLKPAGLVTGCSGGVHSHSISRIALPPPPVTVVQCTQSERTKIVELHRVGWSNAAIARKLSKNVETVRLWVQRGAHSNAKLSNKAGSGRKPSHTAAERKAIKQMAMRGKTAVYIKSNDKYCHLSLTTIRRIIKGGRRPLAYLSVLRGRRLSPANQDKRLQYCRSVRCLDGRRHISADSKFLYMYLDTAGHLTCSWQYPDKRVMHPAHPSPSCFHFYAAIAYGGKSQLVFVPPTRGLGTDVPNGKVTFASKHAIPVLQELYEWACTSLPGGECMTWLLDHAKQHDSKATQAAIKAMGMQLEPGYPPQSYDLNPIEKAWGLLVGNLVGCRARTFKGFKAAIVHAWEAVGQSSINKLMESWGQRVRECEERQGKWPTSKVV